ncbi:hypothetical protein [Tardiphaga robiniae]|uniref:Uncharacterized protein n=1 Tax=Tardiphaga robiniae TaxID=943830 RepID=A0A7G6TTD6_9BRAD|nr:hypothetical protein [Tardiphaga robiniae]QND70018.1 hypothetical protein HB776_01245 [Tardiphaga robiniae]
MTTFIFTLTPDASSAAVERVIAELDAAFPQHEFLAGDPDVGGFENTIPRCMAALAAVIYPVKSHCRTWRRFRK